MDYLILDFALTYTSMKIKVRLIPRNVVQEIEVPKGITVSELLQKIRTGPGPVVVLKNNVQISIDFLLTAMSEFHLIPVFLDRGTENLCVQPARKELWCAGSEP
jgi:sulfur carrier protein ThiS